MEGTPIYGCGTRGRAPGKGVMASDILTHLSDTTQADGRREWASSRGAKVSDIPAQSLRKTFLDGKHERAPLKHTSCPILWKDPRRCVKGHPGYWEGGTRAGASEGGGGLG